MDRAEDGRSPSASGKLDAHDRSGHDMLSIRNLYKHFPARTGAFQRESCRVGVLNGLDLTVQEGEALGLVGESGCGKSTLARIILGLLDPSSGEVRFEGRPLTDVRRTDRMRFYQQVQMIFQDPYSSLNPRLRIRDIIGEMVRIRGRTRREAEQDTRGILEDVGLGEDCLDRYPHEFSGGQRQRIAIARALIVRPRLLVADEPVSALDLSIQSQILSLLGRMKNRYRLTVLFVSHDLNTVSDFCDRIAVMYLGRIVEVLPARSLFHRSLHPYLRALIESIPVPDPSLRRPPGRIVRGEVPSPMEIPPGCPFHPRCPDAIPECRAVPPLMQATDVPDHLVACHRAAMARPS